MSAVNKVSIGGVSHSLLSSPEAIKGGEILTETRKEIPSDEHIISFCEMGPFTPALVTSGKGFEKFGARFFKYVQHFIYFERVRTALMRVEKEWTKKDDDDSNDIIVFSLAIGKMGTGTCGEIASTIAIKAFKANLPEVCQLVFKRSANPIENHSFVIYGKGVEKEIKDNLPAYSEAGIDPLAFIERIKSGIILDGSVLTKPIAARNVRQCPEFVKFMKMHFIDELEFVRRYRDGKVVDDNLELAERFKASIIEVLPSVPPNPVFSKALKENEPRVCADVLKDKVPDSNWKKNAAAQTIWFEGTEERVREVLDYLNAHGIKEERFGEIPGAKWAVFIKNPDVNVVEKLPSFEEWMKEKVASEEKEKKETLVTAASPKNT